MKWYIMGIGSSTLLTISWGLVVVPIVVVVGSGSTCPISEQVANKASARDKEQL